MSQKTEYVAVQIFGLFLTSLFLAVASLILGAFACANGWRAALCFRLAPPLALIEWIMLSLVGMVGCIVFITLREIFSRK